MNAIPPGLAQTPPQIGKSFAKLLTKHRSYRHSWRPCRPPDQVRWSRSASEPPPARRHAAPPRQRQPRRPRPPDRPVALDGLDARRRPAGRRPVIERESDDRAPQQGRPPILLTLDRSAGLVLGIDFGHEHVHVAIADLSRTILAERVQRARRRRLRRARARRRRRARRRGRRGGRRRRRPRARRRRRPVGPDRRRRGHRARRQDPARLGRRAARRRARARASACACTSTTTPTSARSPRSRFGAGIGARDAIYLMVSGGVGAGLILGGELYRGAGGTAGELGHVLVDEAGPICRCGNRGCLEMMAGGRAILEPAAPQPRRRDHARRGHRRCPPTATPARAARSPTPGASSAAPSRPSSMPSTPSWSSSAAESAPPATSCSIPCGRRCTDTPSHRQRRTFASPTACWAIVPRCSARSSSRHGNPTSRLRRPSTPVSRPSERKAIRMRVNGGARRRAVPLTLAAGAAALALVAAGCGDSTTTSDTGGGDAGGGEAGKVAVLLPDSKSSVRWETVDRPFLKAAFDKAGVESDDPERRGRQVRPAAAGRAGDHERREGPAARQPRLRLGRRDRGQRQVPGRQGHRLRPPDAQGHVGLLRLLRQRGRRQAAG